MVALVQTQISGPNCYSAEYLGPAISKAEVPAPEGVHPLRALGRTGTPTDASSQTLTITVDQDVPFIMGSVTTDNGAYPAGATVTLTDPNGNQIGPSQTDSCFVACADDNPAMVQSCMIKNPAAGNWTVTVTNLDATMYVFFSTMPVTDQYATIYGALAPLIDPDPASPATPQSSVSCKVCKAVCWVVAVAIAALCAAGMAFLTAGSAPVVALVALLAGTIAALSANAVVIIIAALVAAVGSAAAIIVTNICSWVNACPTGVTAAITDPRAGSTVSGTTHVIASATNAATVAFYIAQQTLIGTDTTPPTWDIHWDTTKISNGDHTLWALATGPLGAAWSAPVKITIHN